MTVRRSNKLATGGILLSKSFAALVAVAGFIGTACFSSLDQWKWGEALRAQPIGSGESRVFSADVDHIVAAISAALAEAHFDQRLDCESKPFKDFPECLPLTVMVLDDSTRMIAATKTERGFESGWLGTQARFVIRSEGPQRTSVAIISMYRNRRLLGRDDYAHTFFHTMDKVLGAQ